MDESLYDHVLYLKDYCDGLQKSIKKIRKEQKKMNVEHNELKRKYAELEEKYTQKISSNE